MKSGLLLAVLPLLLFGCQPPQAAQTALSTAAHALVAADEVAAAGYASDHAEALEESETREEYDAAMEQWNDVEQAMRVAQQALLSAQDALLTWQNSGGESTFRAALPPLLGALRGVLEVLEVARVSVPDELTEAVRLISAFLGAEDG